MPTSEELLELAERCAQKIELDGRLRHVPSFSDAEEQCEDEYEELLQVIHEDELFAPVDIQRQETLVEQIAAALPLARARWGVLARRVSRSPGGLGGGPAVAVRGWRGDGQRCGTLSRPHPVFPPPVAARPRPGRPMAPEERIPTSPNQAPPRW